MIVTGRWHRFKTEAFPVFDDFNQPHQTNVEIVTFKAKAGKFSFQVYNRKLALFSKVWIGEETLASMEGRVKRRLQYCHFSILSLSLPPFYRFMNAFSFSSTAIVYFVM